MEHDFVIITSSRNIEDTANLSHLQYYLRSAKGRAALAQSMVSPIRRNLDYHGLARKVFSVQALPMPGDPDGNP